MLQSLHVKNLALMEETEVEFDRGLNILTGETGAGKSLLIGSVSLALGAKFEKEMLRQGADYALVELVFFCPEPQVADRLREMDLEPEEDGTVLISRRMQPGRSVSKINGETVTARQIKELAEVLIDIHGQHEHQSLLHKRKHREILDAYCGERLAGPAERVTRLYRHSRELTGQIDSERLDEAAKLREQSLAEFELDEITEAALIVGEDEELENSYRRMSNSRKITESLSESYHYTGTDAAEGAGSSLSRALRSLRSVVMYDKRLGELEAQLAEVDGLLADYNRDAAEYLSDCEFDEETFARTEERLNTINRLKGKYGQTIPEILEYAGRLREKLDRLADYDAYMEKLQKDLEKTQAALREACAEMTAVRREGAEQLTGELKEALLQLNFQSVEFLVEVREEQAITENGWDDVEFMISTNPGESLKPLAQVASGGELSRVMLAIKTVLAGRDAIDTLIFDEIDAGISGRTAWKVSESLDTLGHAHQVLCITHLPQIAAMADAHFVIEKSSTDSHTITDIRRIEGEESLAELARLLGSDALTDAALENARAMKKQAREHKIGEAE